MYENTFVSEFASNYNVLIYNAHIKLSTIEITDYSIRITNTNAKSSKSGIRQ